MEQKTIDFQALTVNDKGVGYSHESKWEKLGGGGGGGPALESNREKEDKLWSKKQLISKL